MDDFSAVFAELRKILEPWARKLDAKTDTPECLYVDTRHVQKNGKPMFFGAVQTGKRYVSYHLMPVYVDPTLLDGISPELRKRMQGKSCFNFSRIEKPLFKELKALTRAGFARYRDLGLV